MKQSRKQAGRDGGIALVALVSWADCRLREGAAKVSLPAGTVLFRPGDLAARFPIILKGRVLVSRTAHSVKDLLLYYVEAGETCILTTSCLMSSELYAAGAVVEEDAEAWLLPAALFADLMARSVAFRQIVFNGYGTWILKLMQRLEVVQDIPVSSRLAEQILQMSGCEQTIETTHQSLADEIGTAREVVSRLLQTMSGKGFIKIKRGRINILDHQKLTELSQPIETSHFDA